MTERVFCIPGTMCDEQVWSFLKQASVSPDNFRHLAIPRSSSVDQIIEGIAEQLPNEEICLLGFSLGGYLASLFASKYPDRIKQLCVLSNSPCALPEDEVMARRESLAWIRQVGYMGLPDSRIRTLLHEDNGEKRAIYDCIKSMETSLGTEVFLQQLEATTERKDLRQSFEAFTFPVKFCFGESDSLVNRAWIDEVVASNSAISKTIVAGAGHMLPLEKAEALAEILQDWFN